MKHQHLWTQVSRGTGVYDKGEHSVHFETEGTLKRCSCKLMMFFPDEPSLYPVEATFEILTAN